ncbi:MAG: hypothetical protein R2862_01205 [Thermoanaerobaculia bacterium]
MRSSGFRHVRLLGQHFTLQVKVMFRRAVRSSPGARDRPSATPSAGAPVATALAGYRHMVVDFDTTEESTRR